MYEFSDASSSRAKEIFELLLLLNKKVNDNIYRILYFINFKLNLN